MRLNEDPRKRAVVWQRNDDAQARCIRGCIEVAWPQPPWFRADVAAVRRASNSRANSVRWRRKRMNRRRGCVLCATAIDESSCMGWKDAGCMMRADKRKGTPAMAGKRRQVGCSVAADSEGAVRSAWDGSRPGFRKGGGLHVGPVTRATAWPACMRTGTSSERR